MGQPYSRVGCAFAIATKLRSSPFSSAEPLPLFTPITHASHLLAQQSSNPGSLVGNPVPLHCEGRAKGAQPSPVTQAGGVLSEAPESPHAGAGVPLAAAALMDETQFLTTNDGVPVAYDVFGRTGPAVVRMRSIRAQKPTCAHVSTTVPEARVPART